MKKCLFTLVATLLAVTAMAQGQGNPLALREQGAWRIRQVEKTPINATTVAGKNLVAVGARGAVMISADDGLSWHQAKSVPVNSTLNSVSFPSEKMGWAVGHNGVILHSEDGGDTWSKQRWESDVDQPLFSVHFKDENNGMAVGLWSRILKTEDGGKSWNEVALPTPPAGAKKDLNFLQILGSGDRYYIAAEGGWVISSSDAGKNWTYTNVGSKASLWACAVSGQEVWVGGLLGKLYRSQDFGKTWSAINAGLGTSITAIQLNAERKTVIALDGYVAQSEDNGKTWKTLQRPDRSALTSLLTTSKRSIAFFGKAGVLSAE